jgi:hypothetical protein
MGCDAAIEDLEAGWDCDLRAPLPGEAPDSLAAAFRWRLLRNSDCELDDGGAAVAGDEGYVVNAGWKYGACWMGNPKPYIRSGLMGAVRGGLSNELVRALSDPELLCSRWAWARTCCWLSCVYS